MNNIYWSAGARAARCLAIQDQDQRTSASNAAHRQHVAESNERILALQARMDALAAAEHAVVEAALAWWRAGCPEQSLDMVLRERVDLCDACGRLAVLRSTKVTP